MEYIETLNIINKSSKDNGYRTTLTDRRLAICSFIEKYCQNYELVHDGLISLIYKHKNLESNLADGKRLILISSHLDESYQVPCFHKEFDASGLHNNKLGRDAWIGTFDNAATNAAVLCAMVDKSLPESALIVFEGNEEGFEDDGNDDDESSDISGNGVFEAMVILKHYQSRWGELSLAIVLDVTPYKGGKAHYTVENYFVAMKSTKRLSFDNENALLKEALRALPGTPNLHHEDACEDSSWGYDEHEVNAISLCLPVLFIGDEDFEDPRGQVLLQDSAKEYTTALVKLANHMSQLGCA